MTLSVYVFVPRVLCPPLSVSLSLCVCLLLLSLNVLTTIMSTFFIVASAGQLETRLDEPTHVAIAIAVSPILSLSLSLTSLERHSKSRIDISFYLSCVICAPSRSLRSFSLSASAVALNVHVECLFTGYAADKCACAFACSAVSLTLSIITFLAAHAALHIKGRFSDLNSNEL